MEQKKTYSPSELMIINTAQLLQDGDVVFVGVGQPNLACNLAKRTHAPNLVMIYEAGVIGAEPARLPLSIGDPTLVSGALSIVSMYDIFALYLQRGNIDVGFMGGAQIDRYGNVNATIIGKDYHHPRTRLPGSGGAQEIAAWANRCYIMTPHEKRRFPERVDFLTSAGFLSGHGERQAAGLRGGGMLAVVTDIGILEPDPTGELVLTTVHPGRTAAEAQANTGWDLKVDQDLKTSTEVKDRELLILRQELDPSGILSSSRTVNLKSEQLQGSPSPPPRRRALETVFISPGEPRLRAGWRLTLQIILQLVLSTVASLALIAGWSGVFAPGVSPLSGSQIMLIEVGELFAVTASIVLARRILDHRSFSSLGLRAGRQAARDFVAGLAITFVMMGLIFLLEIAVGWLHISSFAWQTERAQQVLSNAGMFAVICILVGWNEELMSRGYHFQTVASGTSTGWGWFLSSVVFGILHISNPNASWMAVAGIFLAGLFLGYGFIRSRQLWLPIGLHTGWNFFEGVVFGFPVSGLAFYPLPRTVVSGPPVWTGGDFGPEAGIVSILALGMGFVLVWLYTRAQRSA